MGWSESSRYAVDGLLAVLLAPSCAACGDVLDSPTAGPVCARCCAIAVPLHPWRRIRRGFNQANELAHRLNLPVVHALWRLRPTAPQTGLTARARRRNVADVFVLSPWMRRRSARLAWLENRSVVLV